MLIAATPGLVGLLSGQLVEVLANMTMLWVVEKFLQDQQSRSVLTVTESVWYTRMCLGFQFAGGCGDEARYAISSSDDESEVEEEPQTEQQLGTSKCLSSSFRN